MPRPAVKLPGYWLGSNDKVQVHMGLYDDEDVIHCPDGALGPADIDNNRAFGDLNHDGSNVGFFGNAPAAQPAAHKRR